MDIEGRIFQRKRPDFSRFRVYGLSETPAGYHFERDFMNGDFRALIDIDHKGEVSGSVIDKMNNEEYTPLRSEAQNGAYVSSVRDAYRDVLADIAEKCYKDVLFVSDQANRIAEQIYDRYHDRPDFPWDEKPYRTSGVFRHRDTAKWYGLIMNVKKRVIDPASGELEVDVLNLKIDGSSREELHKEAGIYPGYHMNHKLWISVVLDETLSDNRIMELVDVSYRLTDKKEKKSYGSIT